MYNSPVTDKTLLESNSDILRNFHEPEFLSGTLWGLPTFIWIILLVSVLLLILFVSVGFCCYCWLQKKYQKVIINGNRGVISFSGEIIKIFIDEIYLINLVLASPANTMLLQPPQYTNPPAAAISMQKQHKQQQIEYQPQYKSMWAIGNPMYVSRNGLGDPAPIQSSSTSNLNDSKRTQSLPSRNKQRPVSSIEDLDELYAKVNFCKKSKNRMRNNQAAIIARSRSQNIAQFLQQSEDAFVVYDERTAL